MIQPDKNVIVVLLLSNFSRNSHIFFLCVKGSKIKLDGTIEKNFFN